MFLNNDANDLRDNLKRSCRPYDTLREHIKFFPLLLYNLNQIILTSLFLFSLSNDIPSYSI